MKLEKIGDYSFKLLEDITVSTSKRVISVPQGFIFDGASIPRALWSLIGCPIVGRYLLSATVHDYLYSKECIYNITREEADEIFYELMLQDNVNKYKAYSMLIGVRLGGKDRFRNGR